LERISEDESCGRFASRAKNKSDGVGRRALRGPASPPPPTRPKSARSNKQKTAQIISTCGLFFFLFPAHVNGFPARQMPFCFPHWKCAEMRDFTIGFGDHAGGFRRWRPDPNAELPPGGGALIREALASATTLRLKGPHPIRPRVPAIGADAPNRRPMMSTFYARKFPNHRQRPQARTPTGCDRIQTPVIIRRNPRPHWKRPSVEPKPL